MEAVKEQMLSLKLPEAEPIIFDVRDDREKSTNLFRIKGFNRKRQEASQRRHTPKSAKGQSDADTDGQYDSGIDSVGDGEQPAKRRKKKCIHRQIEKYRCVACNYRIERFGTFFDSGCIPLYMRIFQVSDSEDCIKELGKEVDLIYQSFQATNIIQLRDQMQTMIGKSIISHLKSRHMDLSAHRLLPREAVYSETIPHLKRFDTYLKDFKEQKKFVMRSDALFIDSHFESGNIEKVYKN